MSDRANNLINNLSFAEAFFSFSRHILFMFYYLFLHAGFVWRRTKCGPKQQHKKHTHRIGN